LSSHFQPIAGLAFSGRNINKNSSSFIVFGEIMIRTVVGSALLAAAVLSGCAINVPVSSQSGASEVMSTRVSKANAHLVISDNLATLGRDVKSSFTCGAYNYPMHMGDAIAQSLSETVGAAYNVIGQTNSTAAADGKSFVFRFDVADFDPQLHFIRGFWTLTADANVSLGIRARISTGDGQELLTTTFRGQGHGTEDGGCPAGSAALSRAASKALQDAMESFVDKAINTGVLAEHQKLETLK
jgi:hypothetical protein